MKYGVLQLILIVLFSAGAINCSAGDYITTIWSSKKYSAFTSLQYVNGFFYCAFREATKHRVDINDLTTLGKIIVIRSSNMKDWSLYTSIKKDSCDMRDPNLSLTPDGRIMLLYFSRSYAVSGTKDKLCSYVVFGNDKGLVTSPEPIKINGYNHEYRWLWKIRWHKNKAYGFMYGSDFLFLTSSDGINYDILYSGKQFGERVTEAVVIFKKDTAIAVARGLNNKGLYGIAYAPFISWDWKKMNIGVAGPYLLQLPNEQILLGTRNYQEQLGQTSLYELLDNNARLIETIDEARDSSYPSFLIMNNNVYMSYYAGNKNCTSIKAIRIPIIELEKLCVK